MLIRPSNRRYFPAPTVPESGFENDPVNMAAPVELHREVETDAAGRAWTRIALAPALPA
ncbi:hypothetical protein HUO13_11875 [Saccharopolyspora erythraea]|uniref:hypothetical protein n=1 Tax=Saccharopolyspora erythraea TaxID=1836 RepID=UPI001BA82BFB|nr:hypothetical protein [Saccharopolyspora erythraea]QUH01413.1 hypothetical protein HUO13_11875 [Saccharopolyspora erythraea]